MNGMGEKSFPTPVSNENVASTSETVGFSMHFILLLFPKYPQRYIWLHGLDYAFLF